MMHHWHTLTGCLFICQGKKLRKILKAWERPRAPPVTTFLTVNGLTNRSGHDTYTYFQLWDLFHTFLHSCGMREKTWMCFKMFAPCTDSATPNCRTKNTLDLIFLSYVPKRVPKQPNMPEYHMQYTVNNTVNNLNGHNQPKGCPGTMQHRGENNLSFQL